MKPRIALMTYAIDGRQAKGTALVARKCVEELLKMRDRFDLTFIHYEKSDDPIYGHGVREVLFPRLPGFLNKRSLRQIWYFFTTQDRFDIVQWFQPRLYPFFWKAPARHIVVEVHGAGDVAKEAPFDVMRYVFNWTVKTFIRRIDRAIVASEFAKKDIVEKYGFAPEQVRVIYSGSAPEFKPASAAEIARVRVKYALPERFLIGVGRLNPNKNVFRTLRAYARYAAETHDGIHFVNVGAKGLEKAAIDVWLSTCPVKDQISFIPFVEDADFPAVYSAATALVFPLLNEGFGLPLIEAMACGVPVIVSETAFPDITKDEAYLVEATSEESIAAGITAVMEDAALREKLRTNGLIRAHSLTWTAMGEKLTNVFNELSTT